jgi:hypothetical protein
VLCSETPPVMGGPVLPLLNRSRDRILFYAGLPKTHHLRASNSSLLASFVGPNGGREESSASDFQVPLKECRTHRQAKNLTVTGRSATSTLLPQTASSAQIRHSPIPAKESRGLYVPRERDWSELVLIGLYRMKDRFVKKASNAVPQLSLLAQLDRQIHHAAGLNEVE